MVILKLQLIISPWLWLKLIKIHTSILGISSPDSFAFPHRPFFMMLLLVLKIVIVLEMIGRMISSIRLEPARGWIEFRLEWRLCQLFLHPKIKKGVHTCILTLWLWYFYLIVHAYRCHLLISLAFDCPNTLHPKGPLPTTLAHPQCFVVRQQKLSKLSSKKKAWLIELLETIVSFG